MNNDLYKADIISNIQRYGVATNTPDIVNTMKSLEDTKKISDDVLANTM
jgi:hypothetical protein